jgi:hypothetical protein
MDSFTHRVSFSRRKRRTLSGNNESQDDSVLSSTNLSDFNSPRRPNKSKTQNQLTESQYQELMRKKMLCKRLNARKESRHLLFEKKRNIQEEEGSESDETTIEEEKREGVKEKKEKIVMKLDTNLSPVVSQPTKLPVAVAPHLPAFTSVNLNQEDPSSKKSFGSNLVKKMNTIKNKFNTFVKSSKLSSTMTSQLTKCSSTSVIQAPSQAKLLAPPPPPPTLAQSKPQQSASNSMRRSTSAFNVAAIDTNKYMRKQNSVSSCNSMSSISSCSTANALLYHGQKRVANLRSQRHHSSSLSLASKENKKPPFKSSFRIAYNDKHLYEKVSYQEDEELTLNS